MTKNIYTVDSEKLNNPDNLRELELQESNKKLKKDARFLLEASSAENDWG